MDPSQQHQRRANVVGLGLIGGSLALALQQLGFVVGGSDVNPDRVAEALSRGVCQHGGLFADAEISFVATPPDHVVDVVHDVLASTSGVVTDVGSVKSRVCAAIDSPRFLGGHPMAGSELDGLDGADATMFAGATWVLTPNSTTPDDTFETVVSIVSSLGAEVVAMQARQHDEFVAVISHVPHLTAATLMTLADTRSEEHLALLRLAAGGFRDMTRIASGRPEIWLDICDQNRDSIVSALNGLIDGLQSMASVVSTGDRKQLLSRLEQARRARQNLPSRVPADAELSEVRIPIPDRPGSAAEVFTLAGELAVDILDFEVVHSSEGNQGVIVTVVAAAQAEIFRGGLMARGFRPAAQRLS